MPLNKHQTITHQTAVLVAYYGVTKTEAYDLLITARYDMAKAVQLITDARDANMAIPDLLAAYTPIEVK